VLATVRRRIVRLARRSGIDVERDGIVDGDRRDELAEESPLLSGLAAASVAGRAVPAAGRRRTGNSYCPGGSVKLYRT
jgi:hypothetical protein